MTKYLGPKTDAANLAAQGDLPIAVSSTPPAGASEGDLWLDSDTGRLYCYYDSQWINPASVGRSVSTAAATTITGTNSEGTSNSLARADHNHAFGSKSVPASALALGPSHESSLPGSPVDGQEIYYAANATDGVIWHLRYRSGSSSSYKWEFIGGSPLYKADNDVRSVTSGTFTDIPTDTIVQAVPLAGEYLVQHGANMEINPGNRTALYGYAITDANDANATNPDDRECTILGQPVSSGAILASYNQMANVRTITTAGYKFRERAKSTFGTDTLTVYARRLVVTPIRVG